jgi:hypothetical protein
VRLNKTTRAFVTVLRGERVVYALGDDQRLYRV